MGISCLVSSIPNALSLTRVALALAFPWIPAGWRVAAVVTAALTDLLDGMSSRHWHTASSIGRILDPVADKVFILCLIGTLLYEGSLTAWEVALVGLRDWVVLTGIGWVLLQRDRSSFRRLAPTVLGKATTAAQFLFVLVILVQPQGNAWVFGGTVALSTIAAVDYIWRFASQEGARPTPRP